MENEPKPVYCKLTGFGLFLHTHWGIPYFRALQAMAALPDYFLNFVVGNFKIMC